MKLALPEFMASPASDSESQRPCSLRNSKSFSAIEPVNANSFLQVRRASTIQNGVPDSSSQLHRQVDALERASEDGEASASPWSTGNLPDDFDELPIELISLSDSFIDSLSAKIHPTPPSIEKLSGLFQNFYTIAASHINTHISTLSSRQNRKSSAPPVSSISSTANMLRAKAASIGHTDRPKPAPERTESEQQMLTGDEIIDRKRARKMLEHTRTAMEEAVERRVCEGIYDQIWRHSSTYDEAQDEKLRSKTAALSVVGIGLNDLGVELGGELKGPPNTMEEREKEAAKWLGKARTELVAMNDKKYPLGKLRHLKMAHKAIVDTLSHFHPSSSADEIMPMLIYALITSRPEGINVTSNLYFIQRFRNETKVDGEAAYCLTNLEAAISFLETVDLASLRADEVPSGPPKSNSRPSTPSIDKVENKANVVTISPSPSAPEMGSEVPISILTKRQEYPMGLRPIPQAKSRRLSNLFQPPAALGAAGDAVLNTADQGFKTIGNSLGDSYKYLFGKLKERQEDANGAQPEIIVPKTLDDARKLVGTPPPEDDGSRDSPSSLDSPEIRSERTRTDSGAKAEDKLLYMIGGRKLPRERSVDSSKSGGSNKRVAFVEEEGEKSMSPSVAPSSTNPALVESMRNLGNSLNPINRIAGMGMMRSFGRATPPPTPAPTIKAIPDGGIADLTTVFPDLAPVVPPKAVPKIAPPIKKFMELENPGDLRLCEVLELLRDYRRLAGALKETGTI